MSEKIIDVSGKSISSSRNSEQCHKTCLAACVADMYSASAVDNATEACFFELQATAPPAIVITYLLVDFLSDPPAQSASQNIFISSFSNSSAPP